MRVAVVLLGLTLSTIRVPAAQPAPWTCATRPVEACATRHGRLSSQNGIALRIWLIGTNRVVGLDNDEASLPTTLRKYLDMTSPDHSDVFGDFDICPVEPDTPGHLRRVCVTGARNLVVQPRDGRPPFRLTQTPPDAVRAGVMITSPDGPVAAIDGAPVPAGTAITLVGIDSPQQVWHASIARSVPASDATKKHAMAGPFYGLEVESGGRAPSEPAIAVVGRGEIARAGDVVALRIGNPARNVRVRSCASMEGLHLTLWAGEPLRSPRLWHSYYYVGYDTQPTCTPADTNGIWEIPLSRPVDVDPDLRTWLRQAYDLAG